MPVAELAAHSSAPRIPKLFAYAYEIRPVPMVATLLAAYLGALFAGGDVAPDTLTLYLVAVASALYCGHAVDSIVDYHLRGETKFVYMGFFEDSGGLLSARELGLAASVACLVFTLALLDVTRPGTLLFWISVAGLAVAASYSALLDRNPVTVSLAYPIGTTLALLGGVVLAGGTDATRIAALAFPVLVYLVGGKIVSDLIDHDADRAIGKRTVVVVFGREKGKRIGYALCLAALLAALFSTAQGVLPPASAVGVALAGLCLAASYGMSAAKGVLVLVAGGYLFLGATIVPLV